ncbi:trypsin-like peptidase domain-containing protein [Lapillicoccus sp.]|uniref:S1C family serine protease n=1 Tax=Lapillicoccus sp. TaxID=1909287 RepID=UPI0032644778
MARALAPPEVSAVEPPGGDGPERPGSRRARLQSRMRVVPRRLWVAVMVVLLLAAAALAFALTRPAGPAPITQADVNASVQKGVADQAKKDAQAPAAAALAYQAIQPSLVLIQTIRTSATGAESGSGAGVIVNADGTILTALHVVVGAQTINVQYTDGTSSTAKVASTQPDNDIATLAPATLPQTVVPAVLGGGVQVGSPVFAVGHPLGLTDSLSAGVVSALDRTVPVKDGKKLEHLIQIDAAVNPGNSGGPLLNRAGQVVGIVTGLANPGDQGFFVGIGFAVPIATAGGAAGSPPQ